MTETSRLSIDHTFFFMAFGRDVDYHDTCPQSVFLDLETGDILWTYDTDEDADNYAGIPVEENAANRKKVSTNPDKYLKIPGLTHGEHHEILQEFLSSDWTDDEDMRRQTEQTYIRSIGGWIEAVNDEKVVHSYFNYRDQGIELRALEFLSEHGIEPVWK